MLHAFAHVKATKPWRRVGDAEAEEPSCARHDGESGASNKLEIEGGDVLGLLALQSAGAFTRGPFALLRGNAKEVV